MTSGTYFYRFGYGLSNITEVISLKKKLFKINENLCGMNFDNFMDVPKIMNFSVFTIGSKMTFCCLIKNIYRLFYRRLEGFLIH